MIPDYVSLAANERTYLAWVRTGIAIIALGFVIEKFDLFVLAIAGSAFPAAHSGLLARLAGPVGRYGGAGLVIGGVALIGLATLRFFRTQRLLTAPAAHPHGAAMSGLLALTGLVLAAALFTGYLALW